MVVLPYGLLLVDSSPPDYKSFRSSEHKPHGGRPRWGVARSLALDFCWPMRVLSLCLLLAGTSIEAYSHSSRHAVSLCDLCSDVRSRDIESGGHVTCTRCRVEKNRFLRSPVQWVGFIGFGFFGGQTLVFEKAKFDGVWGF